MSMKLVLPSFDGVRLATLEDLPRVAIVAAAGFFHSPSFQFQRIHHAEFPNDTLLSYCNEYQASILDPACVVLVAEDVIVETEGHKVYDALRGAAAYKPGVGSSSVKVIVGVASICMKPGSSYIGQFQTRNLADSRPTLAAQDHLGRDQCLKRASAYDKLTAPAKAKYLAGQMRLSTLAVHPAYWHRGHATRLVGWCTRLADLDGVAVGVSAVPMGAALAAKAGFEERELVRLEQSRVHDETARACKPNVGDIELWVAIRRPSGSPGSDESATSMDSQQ